MHGLRGLTKAGDASSYVENYAFSKTRDPWFIITDAVEKVALSGDDSGNKPLAWLTGLVAWANPAAVPKPAPGTEPAIPDRGPVSAAIADFRAWEKRKSEYERFLVAQRKTSSCLSFTPPDVGFCALEAGKAAARGIIVNTILADRIDLGGIRLPDGQNVNDWINSNIGNLVPPEYRALVEGVRLMPLDLTESPIRRYMLEQAYEEIWKVPLKDEWYEAISNELRNAKSGSLATAVSLLKNSKYSPKGKAPVVKLKPDALRISEEQGERPTGTTRPPQRRDRQAEAADEGMSTTVLAVGGIAAAALIGLGIYFRGR